MLKILRNKKIRKKIFIGLALVIIPAFTFWGFSSALKSKQESNYAGRLYGRDVPIEEFKEALSAVKNQAIMQFGDKFEEAQAYLNLESQAWDRIIILTEAKKRRINASDKEVIELIETSPVFSRNGQFDNRIYTQILQYVFRTQPRAFEEQLRQNIIIGKLYTELTNGIKLSDNEIKDEYLKVNQDISIYYIASIISDFAKDIKPTEDELKGYFTKNAFEFKRPVSFNIVYAVTDTEDKIKSVLRSLKKSNDLLKAAKEAQVEAKESGFFTQGGAVPGVGWNPPVMDLVSKLKVGRYSKPLLIDKRYYILQLKEKIESTVPEFNAVKEAVKESFTKSRSKEIAETKINDCLKKLKNLPDFNRAAKALGLKSDFLGPFKFGTYIEGIGTSDDFWLQASQLKEKEYSGIINMPSGFYIIKPKIKTPINEKKFAAEKEDFSKKLLLQKKEEFFTRFLEDLKRKAQ